MLSNPFFWISIVLALAVVWFIYRNAVVHAKATKKLAAQKRAIEERNETIQSSLKEKEVLLKEIHHRVKNNLQLVSSLLQLQSGKFEDPEVLKALEEGQGRVQSMAMIHQMLYENEDLTSIDLDVYFDNLLTSIRSSFGELSADIKIHHAKSGLHVEPDTVVPLGLICNELFYNCFKYAFTGKEAGNIFISLEQEREDSYRLTIKDDGNGLPKDFDQRSKKSLGVRLVNMLSRQLDGKVEYDGAQGGTLVQVYFRLDWKE